MQQKRAVKNSAEAYTELKYKTKRSDKFYHNLINEQIP
jgi:hypothetical protein